MTDQSILDLSPPKRKNWILKQDDMDRQIALWACEYGFDLLVPEKEPEIPSKVEEYNRLPSKDKFKMCSNPDKYTAFWGNSEVKTYFDRKYFYKIENETNKTWLKKIKTWLDPEKDTKQIERITQRLRDFVERPVIKQYTPQEQKIRNIFESEEE